MPEENNFLPMPKEWIGQYHNACTEPCDMLVGSCVCGAYHHIDEWFISRKRLTNSGWQNPLDTNGQERNPMTPDKITQIREAVKKIRKYYYDLNDELYDELDKILALLPCETCDGIGNLTGASSSSDDPGYVPCPDCT